MVFLVPRNYLTIGKIFRGRKGAIAPPGFYGGTNQSISRRLDKVEKAFLRCVNLFTKVSYQKGLLLK